MKQWLEDWYEVQYQIDGSYVPMMGNLSILQGKALEQAYIQGMIEHHQGAIDMAKQVLTLSQRLEIQTLAQDIITAQSMEIETFRSWLTSDHQMMGH